MNDPKDQPIDIDDQRTWFNEHKEATGLSWKQLGGSIGISHSSLSLFCNGNYAAPGDRIAEAIFRYRQTLAAQASIKVDLPEMPGYFETATSGHLVYLLGWAHRGRMAAAAMSPGLGKTITADHYQACNSNVFIITGEPATASLMGMMSAVASAIGITHTFYRNHEASAAIVRTLKNMSNALLVIDEAQALELATLNQLRSWHDKIGVGVALLGNAGLLQNLEGTSRSVDRAQLFSRISFKLPRLHPLAADIDAMLEAWRIHDEEICALTRAIAMKPGALRGASFALELAHMIAASSGKELSAKHLKDAWAQLSTRPVAP